MPEPRIYGPDWDAYTDLIAVFGDVDRHPWREDNQCTYCGLLYVEHGWYRTCGPTPRRRPPFRPAPPRQSALFELAS